MTDLERAHYITAWIGHYARENHMRNLVVGISGGIDSSVVSALCAQTGMPVTAVIMPIHQSAHTHGLSIKHGLWLTERYANVSVLTLDLSETYDSFVDRVSQTGATKELALANSRSRLRMMTLYQIAQSRDGLVVGTGNRVEDFGVGFFTKYGDGGVDISPIGDCVKTQVWAMGRALGILEDIIEAAPTDGLWSDGRTDEQQLGMTYPQLEAAMWADGVGHWPDDPQDQDRLQTYRAIRRRNLHKMLPVPVCQFHK